MIRYLLVIMVLILCSVYVHAQVDTQVKVTGKHASWLDKFKSVKGKKQKTEREAKKKQKQVTDLRDSLSTLDSARYRLSLDSTSVNGLDSLSLVANEEIMDANKEAVSQKSEKAITEAIEHRFSGTGLPPNELPTGRATGPSFAPGQTNPKDINLASLAGGANPDMLSEADPPLLNETAKPKVNPGAMTVSKMNGIMDDIGIEKLDAAHESMTKLKEEYTSVPSLDKPEEGIKKQSLKGQPLHRRFYLGGNASIPSTDPLKIDSDIQVGYRFNKRFESGISLTWRESFNAKADSLNPMAGQVYGYGLFVKYNFGAGFYSYAEYSSLRSGTLIESNVADGPWQYRYLIGLGKEFRVTKFLKLSTTILYDLNHRNNDLHPLPFVMRVGYRLNKP